MELCLLLSLVPTQATAGSTQATVSSHRPALEVTAAQAGSTPVHRSPGLWSPAETNRPSLAGEGPSPHYTPAAHPPCLPRAAALSEASAWCHPVCLPLTVPLRGEGVPFLAARLPPANFVSQPPSALWLPSLCAPARYPQRCPARLRPQGPVIRVRKVHPILMLQDQGCWISVAVLQPQPHEPHSTSTSPQVPSLMCPLDCPFG